MLAQYRLYRRSYERGSAKSENKWADIQPWVYSDADILDIASRYEAEKPRGTKSLAWDAVVVGEEIPPRTKGPLTSTSMVTYLGGWGAYFTMTDRIAHEYMRLHPGAIAMDAQHNVRDLPERAHWDQDFAREIGFPMGYDIGTQRISWYSHLLTDWIGDRGRVLQLSVKLREPLWMWDLTTLHGRVTSAEIGAEGPTVALELWGETQRGRRHSEGTAVVVLGDVEIGKA